MRLLKVIKNNKYYHLLLIILALFIATITVTLGRYAYYEIKDYYLESKKFYFNADKLDTIRRNYQIDNWSGIDPFSITFNLNSYKNNLEKADSDITYSITFRCSSTVICESTKTEGTVYASTNSDSFIITITPQEALKSGDSVWLDIDVRSTSPYTKYLRGRFYLIVGESGLSYEIEDVANRPYLEVNITNTIDFYEVDTAFGSYNVGDRIDITSYMALSEADQANCSSAIVTLTFNPNEVVLDMTTHAYLKNIGTTTTTMSDGYDYLNSVTFKIDAVSSESVIFYKTNTANDYTYPFVNDTSIVEVSYS